MIKIISKNKIGTMLDYNFSVKDSDFFSSTFCTRRIFKDILALRHTYGETKKILRIYEGITYNNIDIQKKIIKHIADIEINSRKNNFLKKDIALYYVEKVRRKHWLCITYDMDLYINNKKYTIIGIQNNKISDDYGIDGIVIKVKSKDNKNVETIYNIKPDTLDICISPNVFQIIKEICEISEYTYDYLYLNPVSRSSYNERENYFKLILTFFFMNGYMNSKQIFHIVNIAKSFNMSSKTTEKIIKDFFNLNFNEYKEVWNRIIKKIKNIYYLSIDIVYMITVGEYNSLHEYQIFKKSAEMLNVPIDKLKYIFDFIKRKEGSTGE